MEYSLFFETLQALHWKRMSEREFDALSPEEKAIVIAHYRTHMQIEAVIAKDMERKRRQAAKKK